MSNLNFELKLITGERFAQDLRNLFDQALPAYQQAREASSVLGGLGVSISTPDFPKMASEVIQGFLKNVESELTKQYSEGTHARIDLQDDFMWTSRRIREVTDDATDYALAVELILQKFPFEECAKHARLQASSLEDVGLQKAADSLAQALHLIQYNWGHQNPLIRSAGSRFICKYTFDSFFIGYNYAWQDESGINAIASDFRVMEQEMGDLGITAALQACAKQLRGERHPSRTKVVAGGPVECIAFKNHMDLRFSQEATDMLLAFLKLHSSRTIVDVCEV